MIRDYYSLEDALAATDFRKERPFRCHVHDDSQASASVNIDKGVWVCYTCGAKGRVDSSLIILDGDRIGRDVEEMLRDIEPISERMLDLYCAGPVHPYWLSRFGESACRHFQLGYDMHSERPCYPMRYPDGTLAGIVRRNTESDGPKYRYPFGFSKSDFIFNFDPNHRSVVILHEGAMDVVASWEAAYDAFGIYGARLSEAQATLLQKVSPDLVVCAFDNDRAGRAATDQVREMISDWVQVEEFPWASYDRYKDIAELPITIRSRALDAVAS